MVVNYKLIYAPYIHRQFLENQTSILRKSGYQINGKVDNKILEKWLLPIDKIKNYSIISL